MRPLLGPIRFALWIATALSLLPGCDDNGDREPESKQIESSKSRAEGASGVDRSAHEARAPVLRRSRELMGTVFRISVAGERPKDAKAPVKRAFDEMSRLEQVLSEWIPDSDISRINAAAGKEAVEVGDETLKVVDAGLDVSRWSRGAFDLSWAALRDMYDFRPGHRKIPEPAEAKESVSKIHWKKVALDSENSEVSLQDEGMAIGTGGIAKGYALDRASEILRNAGIENFMIFGGGQVQAQGTRGGRPWRVGVQHPRRPREYFAFVEVTGSSISTSGDYQHFFMDDDGTRWHHLIDPRTGLPARKATSVTVIAPDGIYADALSTAAFILGPQKAKQMFERMPYSAEFIMLDDECRLVTTDGAKPQLNLTMQLDKGRLPGCGGH